MGLMSCPTRDVGRSANSIWNARIGSGPTKSAPACSRNPTARQIGRQLCHPILLKVRHLHWG
jgi:hypothetical protein